MVFDLSDDEEESIDCRANEHGMLNALQKVFKLERRQPSVFN